MWNISLGEADFKKLVSGETIVKEVTVDSGGDAPPEVMILRIALQDIGYDKMIQLIEEARGGHWEK